MFLGNQRSKPTVAWTPREHSASAAALRPDGGFSRQTSPFHPGSLSAELGAGAGRGTPPRQATNGSAAPDGAASRSETMRSPFADPESPPGGHHDSGGHLSDASDRGLQVPDIVSRWVTSQRGMSPQGSALSSKAPGAGQPADAGPAAHDHAGREEEARDGEGVSEGGNFADSVPLESFRPR